MLRRNWIYCSIYIEDIKDRKECVVIGVYEVDYENK